MVIGIWFVLASVTCFARMRWSIIAYLILSTVDFSGGRDTFAAYNVIKGMVLPLFLLYRLRGFSGHRDRLLAPIAWLMLMLYVGIATVWSVFPQPALKLVGHMGGSMLIVFVLMRATKGGFLSARTVVPVAVGALILAFLCKYVQFGWGDDPGRFTSFMPAQGYAAFIAALFCVALTGRGLTTNMRLITCGALAAALVMNGSRIWFSGIVLASFLTLSLSRARFGYKILSVAGSLALFFMMLTSAEQIVNALGGPGANRITAALWAFYKGDTHSTGLGTFNFRREINESAVNQLENSTPFQLIFGRGTCNGALVPGALFTQYHDYTDPNRMFHNEWLRVAFEWGLIGSVCWLTFIGSIISYAYRGWRMDPDGNAKALLVYLPCFLVGLSGENILAGAGSATSVGFLYTIALASMSVRETEKRKLIARLRASVALIRLRRAKSELRWPASQQSDGMSLP